MLTLPKTSIMMKQGQLATGPSNRAITNLAPPSFKLARSSQPAQSHVAKSCAAVCQCFPPQVSATAPKPNLKPAQQREAAPAAPPANLTPSRATVCCHPVAWATRAPSAARRVPPSWARSQRGSPSAIALREKAVGALTMPHSLPPAPATSSAPPPASVPEALQAFPPAASHLTMQLCRDNAFLPVSRPPW